CGRAPPARGGARELPSPCISVCRMNPSTGFCEGCLRTLDEIAAWSGLDDAGKRRVWRAIELRAEAGFCCRGENHRQEAHRLRPRLRLALRLPRVRAPAGRARRPEL